jgi:hypothetical protein
MWLAVTAEDAVPRLLGGMQDQSGASANAASSRNQSAVQDKPPRTALARALQFRPLSFRRPVASPSSSILQQSLHVPEEHDGDAPTASSSGERHQFDLQGPCTALDSWDNAGTSLMNEAQPGVSGSEWDVVSASLDDSGCGRDLAAGLGEKPATYMSQAQQRVARSYPGGGLQASSGGRAEDEARRLTPTWPLSLYSSTAPMHSHELEVVSRVSVRERQVGQCAVVPTEATAPMISSSSASGGDLIPDCVEPLALQPTLRVDSTLAPASDEDLAEASGSSTLDKVQSSQRGSVEMHGGGDGHLSDSGGVAGSSVPPANNAVPAQPMSRFSAVRQTAARAGMVAAYGARVRTTIKSSLPCSTGCVCYDSSVQLPSLLCTRQCNAK